jgi:hypothetical protein
VPPSAPLTPEQRILRARSAAHALHARRDARETTAEARRTANARFERQVDPDGTLPPDERARRAEHARRSYFLSLALKSAKVRAARKAAP